MSPFLAEQHSFSQQGFPHGAGPAWYGSSRTHLSFRKPVSPQDVYWKRFLQIFHDICGITQPPLPSLLLRNETPVSSPEDAALAEELFLQEAGKVTRSKILWNRSQKSIESKNYTLATTALLRLVEENGRPGVACYLVRKGGTIMLSRDPQKQAIQIAERHNLITHAANLQREWLVDFFATISPPERLAGAFALAFKSGNIDLVRILLQRGASPDSLFQSIPNHFDTLDAAMLELLLQAPTPPSNTTRERWLSAAVAKGKMDLAIVLLRYDTGQSLEYLNVLRKAIEELHIEAFLVALKFMHDSGAMEFEGLLPQIVGCDKMNFANKIIALEATLCVANSKEARILQQRLRIPSPVDQDASDALHLCASSGQVALIELLRNPNFNTNVLSTTLFSAIEACDLNLLDHLYPPGAPTTLPTNFSLSTFPNIQDSATHERLLRRLLQLQIPGTYLDKELLNAIRKQKSSIIRMLLDAGASVNYNGGKALLLAIGSQNVRLVQVLLPHSTGETRKAVFPEVRAAEKLPRRLLTKLFVERGIRGDVLHTAFRDAVCDRTAFRDEALINMLLEAGADYRLVIPASVHGLIDQDDTKALADLLNRMTSSSVSSHAIGDFASRLLEYLMHLPPGFGDHTLRFEMVKLFIKFSAVGDSILSAFEEFLATTPWSDEQLLVLFMSPTPQNRTGSYNTVVARVLSSIEVRILYRLINDMELYDEVLRLALQRAACSALSDDDLTAERVRCLLTRPECNKIMLETSLDFHLRIYAQQCSSELEWPMETINALISKGFAGSIWLTHVLMAIVEGGKSELLSMILNSAKQACTTDMIDSVLMLAVQQIPDREVESLRTLLEFGSSQNGLDTALLMSSEAGNVQRCEILLEYGADVNFRSGECLTSALRQHQHSMVERLLATGNANEASLARAWSLITAAACDIEPAHKVDYYKNILRAGFHGPEVQGHLISNASRLEPDYDVISTILDESETLKQEKAFIQSHATLSVAESNSFTDDPSNLIATLARAVEVGNSRLCRLILSHLPSTFYIPLELLETATITSTSILALLSGRLPGTGRQRSLDICLIRAVSLAADPGTCTYLLYEGASCEAEAFGAISAAAKRALMHDKPDSTHLEALLSFYLSQNALKAAWDIAMEAYKGGAEPKNQNLAPLHALNVLQIILSAGFQDLNAFKVCAYMLCSQPRYRANKCEGYGHSACARAPECCPFQRTEGKRTQIMESFLELGLDAEQIDDRCIVAAAKNHHHEILDILLPSVKDIATSSSKWFADRADCGLFFQSTSQTAEQQEARLKSIRSLLRHGVLCPCLEDALLAAVQESIENAEPRETAEMFIECGVHDKSGTILQFLSANPQPVVVKLLSLVLEREPSRDARLEALYALIASGLDDESTSGLALSALCGPSSQLLELSVNEIKRTLRGTAEVNKSETLNLVLACIPEDSILSPFYGKPCFMAWLLRSCTELTENFLTAVLDWAAPEQISKIDACSDTISLVQEAVMGGKIHLIPLLVSFGAARIKAGKSLLHYTLKNTEGESPELLKAVASLCDESTLDDGSLHLAVVSMRESVVNLLLEQGHDPDFGIPFEEPSEDLQFPLNTLCARVSFEAHNSDDGIAFKRIMTNLLVHGADISGQMCGRSLLFNALDNPSCTIALLRDVIKCLHFSEELSQSLIWNDTNPPADLDPATQRDFGRHVDAGNPQGSKADGSGASARAIKYFPVMNRARFMCPMAGCKITREKMSNLRRHYMKMHPDPKPLFRASQTKRVKWVAETADKPNTSEKKPKQGHFVIDPGEAKTSFYEFENDTHHYSASMYIKQDMPAPPYFEQRTFSSETKGTLLEFLQTQTLPDIFYALNGPQPDDAVGVPLEVLLTCTDCAVCGDKATDIKNVFGNLTENCTHNWTAIMCKDCLDGYMTSKIAVENRAVNAKIACWAEGCKEILSHHEIQRYSDPDLFDAYDSALLQQMIHEGETFASCSTQGCKGGGWLESDDVSYFQCQLCNLETCVSHNGPRDDHRGKPCPATPEGQRYAEEEAREEAERQAAIVAKTKAEEEVKKKAKAEAERLSKEKKEGIKATERLLTQISKKCPTCKVPIEKQDGCDHMTCRTNNGRGGCGAEFCWQCSTLYAKIRSEGNGAHETTCPHYRRNTYLH